MIATFMYICKFISPVTKFLIICESEFVKAIKIGYVTCMRNEKCRLGEFGADYILLIKVIQKLIKSIRAYLSLFINLY